VTGVQQQSQGKVVGAHGPFECVGANLLVVEVVCAVAEDIHSNHLGGTPHKDPPAFATYCLAVFCL
jgi:hypothetical protein